MEQNEEYTNPSKLLMGILDTFIAPTCIVDEHNNCIMNELAKELYSFLTPEFVKFYFLFEREKLVTAHIPESMKDFIFKPVENEEINIMKVDFYRPKKDETPSFTLDDILDKIEKMGVDSLTPEEKNFLDNFEK